MLMMSIIATVSINGRSLPDQTQIIYFTSRQSVHIYIHIYNYCFTDTYITPRHAVCELLTWYLLMDSIVTTPFNSKKPVCKKN